MNEPLICLGCGSPVNAHMLGGLCPVCVKKQALLGDVADSDFEAETIITDHVGTRPSRQSLDSFGDYDLVAPIARGGMGMVYRARQKSLNREVALKMVLAGQFANDEEVRRFQAEAEAAARLDHPHIVPIYEVGEHKGRAWFSMRLIEGGTLAQKVRAAAGGKLSPREAAALLVKIARAVHYAHQRGLIHRDLKPANILLDAQGEPHITDFGLAKEIESEGHTMTGAVLGTPGYMAPEQAAGKVNELTTAVDVFALGAILYHLLTGRPPFEGNSSLEVLTNVMKCEPARPTTAGARIDRDLETIVLRCLEKEPAARFGSAEAFADDLDRWLRGETILARRSTMMERTLKWARRRPAVAGLIFTSFILLFGGVAAVAWQWRRAESEWSRAEGALLQSRESEWKANIAAAKSARVSGRLGQRLGALGALEAAAAVRPTSDLRDEALAALALPDWEVMDESAQELPPDFSVIVADPFSGRWAAASDEHGIILGQIGRPGWKTVLEEGKSRIASLIFAPGGKMIGWSQSRYLASETALSGLIDLTSEPRPKPLGRWEPLTWTTGADAVLVADDSGRFELRRVSDDAVIAVGKTSPPVRGACILANGNRLLLASRSGYDLFENREGQFALVSHRETGAMLLAKPTAHPSAEVAALGIDVSVMLWDLENKRAPAMGKHERPYISTIFHPSGRWMLSHAVDGVTVLWSLSTGKPLIHAEIGLPLAFSRDGDELWTVLHGRIQRLRFHPSTLCRILSPMWGTGLLVQRPCYHPSGRVLAGVDLRSNLNFWVEGQPIPAASFVARTGEASFLQNGALAVTGLPPSIRQTSLLADTFKIGSPEDIPLQKSWTRSVSGLSESQGGAEIALALLDQAVVLDASNLTRVVRTLSGLSSVRTLCYSADGRWLAGGLSNHATLPNGMNKAGEAGVWELPEGKLVHRISTSGCTLRFSPDSRWLMVADSRGYRKLSTEDWHIEHQFTNSTDGLDEPGVAFSPDGRMLAMHLDDRRIRLVDPESNAQLVCLTPPVSTRLRDLEFSPDGTEIAAGSDIGVFIWNLHEARSVLRKMGLDWSASEPLRLPASKWTDSCTPTLRIQIDPQPSPPIQKP